MSSGSTSGATSCATSYTSSRYCRISASASLLAMSERSLPSARGSPSAAVLRGLALSPEKGGWPGGSGGLASVVGRHVGGRQSNERS
jgi:hypothetical protein